MNVGLYYMPLCRFHLKSSQIRHVGIINIRKLDSTKVLGRMVNNVLSSLLFRKL